MQSPTPIIRLALTVAVLGEAVPAAAEDFYAGKTISISTHTGPGGGYDTYLRLLTRHLPRHIPGRPSIVVVNMPGAGESPFSESSDSQIAASDSRLSLVKCRSNAASPSRNRLVCSIGTSRVKHTEMFENSFTSSTHAPAAATQDLTREIVSSLFARVTAFILRSGGTTTHL
jgi:hypothetical protein